MLTGEGELKKRMNKHLAGQLLHKDDEFYKGFKVGIEVAVKQFDEAKKEIGYKLCEYCELQEWGCHNTEECPRNIAVKKWFGDSS